MTDTLSIDREFSALIPPVSQDELAHLEANILREGCRDPLVVWRGLLIDGHTRLNICRMHQLDFDTVELDLADRDAAKAWIIRNQFGRRNLSAMQRAELALKLEPLIARKAEERELRGKAIDPVPDLAQGRPTASEDAPGRTRKKLADIAGIGEETFRKAKILSEEAPETLKEEVRQGKKSIDKAFRELRPNTSPETPSNGDHKALPGQTSFLDDVPGKPAKSGDRPEPSPAEKSFTHWEGFLGKLQLWLNSLPEWGFYAGMTKDWDRYQKRSMLTRLDLLIESLEKFRADSKRDAKLREEEAKDRAGNSRHR